MNHAWDWSAFRSLKVTLPTIFVVLMISLPGWAGSLADDFRNPPLSARPWVYWFFMDGNISREGITADLGQVFVCAQVKLNGKDLGVLWRAPFKLEITDAVKPGANMLEITVANLWPNRLIGDQALPPEKRVAWTTWNPFTKDTPLQRSGLLGPVCYEVVTAP